MYIVQRIVKRTQTQLYKYHQLTKKKKRFFFHHHFHFYIEAIRIYIYISSRLIYITIFPSKNYFLYISSFHVQNFHGLWVLFYVFVVLFFFTTQQTNDKRKIQKTFYENNQTIRI